MLAIFDGRVAKRPDCMTLPHRNAVSALKDDFLLNHFISVYPDSVAIRSESAFTFAYSVDDTPDRFRFAHTDGVFCMYQGFIEDIDAVQQDLNLTEINDAAILAIRAFQNLRQSRQRGPKKEVEDMAGNCISVLYESTSKLVILSSGSYWDLPVYWGIDARFNLVISSSDTIVEKACGSVQPFTSGNVYACCEGRRGSAALFPYKQPELKVNLTDKKTAEQSIESIEAMIRQADKDRSKRCADKWEPPAPNLVKINTDGVLFNDGMIGIGVVIRNYQGDVEFAVTRRKRNELPGLDPVVHAFMEGLHMTEDLFKVNRCVIESVHLNIEENEENVGPVLVAMLLEKSGKMAMKNLTELGVSFVSNGANKAAHRLALVAKEDCYTMWTKEIPECIAGIVESERPVCGCTVS